MQEGRGAMVTMPSSFQISSKFSTHWHDMQWILFQTAICFSSAIFDMHFQLKTLTVTSPKYGMHKFKCSFSKGDPSRGVVSFSIEARISAIAVVKFCEVKVIRNYTDEYSVCKMLLVIHVA